jgi:protein-S-isoprenylcysteine O-methyltransferase Ste14
MFVLARALVYSTLFVGFLLIFLPARVLSNMGVRAPLYLGAGTALAGAALYYRSLPLLGYAGAFMLAAHLFVVTYEERALRAKFADDYVAYCRRVSRWLPRAAQVKRSLFARFRS